MGSQHLSPSRGRVLILRHLSPMMLKLCVLALWVSTSLATEAEHRFEAHTRLVRDLFHNYDKDVIPMTDFGKPVNVSAGMSVSSMDFDDGYLDMTAWWRGKWHDFRLRWDPKEYHGIQQINVPASKIWMPDIEVYNSVDFGPESLSHALAAQRNHLAIIYSSGDVLYIPPSNVYILCDGIKESEDWEWKETECRIKMGSWTYSGEQIDLHPWWNYIKLESYATSPVVFTEDSFKGEVLKSKKYDCCPEDYLSLEYVFKVQRQFKITDEGKKMNENPPKVYQYPENDF